MMMNRVIHIKCCEIQVLTQTSTMAVFMLHNNFSSCMRPNNQYSRNVVELYIAASMSRASENRLLLFSQRA